MPFPTFAKQDEIPEAFRGEYEERDGKWQPKKAEELGDKGKKALDTERQRADDAERRAREAEQKATDLARDAAAAAAGLNAEQTKELRKEIRADIEKEYAGKPLAELPPTWKARLEADSAIGENRSLKLDEQVRKLALSKEGGVRGEKIETWWKVNKDNFDLDKDGKPIVKAKPEVDILKFIQGDAKSADPELYVGTQASGGGSGGIHKPATGGAKMSFEDFSKLPASEKLRIAREADAA